MIFRNVGVDLKLVLRGHQLIRTLAFIALFCSATVAHADKRVAFLVGNANYEHAPSLDNPIKDTELIAATLTELDFDVSVFSNLNRDQIGRELSIFLSNTEGADVTLFYFAGHGLQYDGENFLVGTDTKLETEFDIASEALNLSKVIELLERNSRAALIFIDACRDNPLANAFYAQNFSQTRALMTRGLAPMTRSFQGSMITFSASPGQVAYDGEGANSPFAAALARHLPTENLEVLSLMKRVIRDVKAETGDLQTPMVTNDLTAEIYMRLGGGEGAVLALQQEEALFEAANDLASLRAWDVFLEKYPNGVFSEMAYAARELLQAEEIAENVGVEVAQLAPQSINRDISAGIEAQIGLSRDDNRAVQTALNTRGYDAGPEDGILGTRTRRAIASYQLSVGLPATGVVTKGTAAKLGLEIDNPENSDMPVVSSQDARRYDPEKLGLVESDERLLKAAKALQGKEFRYGFFDDSLYLAVLDWSNPGFEGASKVAERAGGYVVTINSEAENRFIARLTLSDERLWRPNGKRSFMFGPMIGLHQLPNSREPSGGWVWASGETPAYSSWDPYEPTNHNNNESIAVFFIPYNEFSSYRARPRPLKWGDVSGGRRSYVIEVD